MGLYKAPHTQSIKHMKEFKEGDILTLKDVQESFDRINNLSESSEQVDLSGFPIGKDGAVIFETWEEVENTFGRLIPLDDYIANSKHCKTIRIASQPGEFQANFTIKKNNRTFLVTFSSGFGYIKMLSKTSHFNFSIRVAF